MISHELYMITKQSTFSNQCHHITRKCIYLDDGILPNDGDRDIIDVDYIYISSDDDNGSNYLNDDTMTTE